MRDFEKKRVTEVRKERLPVNHLGTMNREFGGLLLNWCEKEASQSRQTNQQNPKPEFE
jgi:hypothetical protein